MKNPIYFTLFLMLFMCGCSQEELFVEEGRRDLWLIHEGAKLPIVVEGNTLSKTFVILLHGGPGSSAQEFNASTKAFTDPLEEEYALVYYDQRNAGLSLGDWNDEKLTIKQHVEDLEKVIELLNDQYGDDINLFLAGHSWGGYLGTRYLLNNDNQSKINAWINIDGLINRNINITNMMERIEEIAVEQIDDNINISAWQNILEQVETERAKSITQYDVDTENNVFDLQRLAIPQIDRDKVLSYNTNSVTSSIYSDNYDPFRILINGDRDDELITQIYNYDNTIDTSLANLNIPSLSIYGYYDVTTPYKQGEYFNSKISTAQTDKALIIFNRSGHSVMNNEPVPLADEMIDWIEKYR